jgi:hypothetical protein
MDDGNGKNDGNGKSGSSDRLQIRIALIGAAGAVVAAVVGALIGLHPWSSDSPTPSASPTGSVSSTASDGPQISISTVQYPVVNGRRVIEVVGTVQNQAANDEVYAFAGSVAEKPPFYYGGPASVRSGAWTAEIANYQGSPGNLAVWAGVLTLPPSTCPGLACPDAAKLRGELVTAGPRAPALKKVTPAFHTTFPSG